MRNLKRALSLGLTAAMISGLMVMGSSAASSSYTDVADTDNVEAIEVLKAVGIMTGDDKGNFNPNQKVTRNEMAVIMSNLMAYNVATYANTSPFTDVPEWAEPYVAACWTNGITAGTSATTYGGNDTVTTAQAALMVMKALGYFQYSSDFGTDWQLSTVAQGNKIDLFEDVDSGVKEAMTRNDVAQLVLNALESGTVEAEKTGQDITVGDITITSGVTYKYVTSGRDYATAINDKLDTNNDGSYSSGAIVELGEKLYQGDLTKKSDAYDDFGRPAVVWEYQTKEIGTFAEKADYTFTSKVTSKALYDRVGKTAVDNYKWSVSVNGEAVEYDGDKLSSNRSDNDSCFLDKAGVPLPSNTDTYTGNGVITEIFVDGTDKTVDVAVINQYAAKVLKVDKDDGTITLSDVNSGPASSSDEFDSTQFAEDDVVIYTYANGDIQSVYAAEKLEGDVTAVRTTTTGGSESDGDYFVVDGTTYNYNKTATKDRLLTENVNNKVVAYLDAQGYVSYIDESAITYDYAYVLSMGTDSDQYGKGSNDKGTTVYARLVLSDGTLIKVETDAKASEIGAKDNSGNYKPTDSTNSQEYLLNHLVSYSKDKNGVYSLSDKSGMDITPSANSSLEVQNGVASMTLAGTRYTANSNTIFIVADPDTDSYDDYDFTIYTGIKNVPDIDGNSNTQVVVATESGNSKVAKVVYIEDADVSGTGEVIFARADQNAKYVKDSDIGNYYEINAWKDGQSVTLKVKENSSAADALVKSPDTTYAVAASDSSSNAKYLVALKSVTENSDGLITSVRTYGAYDKTSGDGIILGKGTLDAEKSTVGLTGIQQLGSNPTGSASIRYAWTDDAISIQYNDKTGTGEFKTNRISSINDDNNDLYVAVLDGDVITGLCVVYREGGDGSTNGGTVSPDVKVTINSDKTITVTTENKTLTTSQAVTEITNYLKNQGYELGTVKELGGKYVFPVYERIGNDLVKVDDYTFDPSSLDQSQNITVTINGKSVTVKNGTKMSDLDTLDDGYGKYLDDKGTSVNNSNRVLKSGDVIDLYGKVTLNGKDQYGKIGSAVELSGNWYNEGKTSYADYKAVSGAKVTYTVADQTINDGFYKVQIDAENPQFYTAADPHEFTQLKDSGTGFIVSEDNGNTWNYVKGSNLTTSNKDLMIQKGYVEITYAQSGESNGYKWTIEDGTGYAKANSTLDVKYTVSNDNMQSGDVITVTFGGVSTTTTDKFNANGTSMSRTAHGLGVGTTDITVSISNISK